MYDWQDRTKGCPTLGLRQAVADDSLAGLPDIVFS